MTPIAKITSLQNGAPIDSISGVLENVYERKAGTTKGRPWSFQNLIIKDNTGSIKVTLSGRKECSNSMEGRIVTLSSVRGSNGLDGVFAEDNTYNNKTTRLVKVTEVAAVSLFVNGGNGAGAAAPKNPAPPSMPRAGAKVGMAINNANLAILASSPTMVYFLGEEYPDDLYQIATANLAVSDALENNTPLPKREKPAAPKPPTDENFLQGNEEVF